MSEMKYRWGHNRPYNAGANAMKKEYGYRVQKLSVNAGFTCPNRDGNKSSGGCTFCDNQSFSPSYCHQNESITDQLQRGIRFHEKRYRKAGAYFAYFQSFSNTYASVEILKKRYDEALAVEGVTGLIIGTRPDCISPELLDLISKYAEKYSITVELGIESVYNESLQRVNRGHTFEDTLEAFKLLKEYSIRAGGHYILGLPGETRQMMLDSAKVLSSLTMQTLKFHQLQIIDGTRMGEEYKNNPESFQLFDLDDYVEFIAEYLTILNPGIVVERLAGEAPPAKNLGKHWGVRYDKVVQMVENFMLEKGWYQGMNYGELKNKT